MKHEFYLSPRGRQEVAATGQYIGYVSGAGEIEVNVDGEHHYLNVNEVLQVDDTFKSFAVTNMASVSGDFVIKAGMGKLYMAGDGQTTEVLRIRETVKTEMLNHNDVSTPIVEEIDALSGKTLKTNVQNHSDISAPIVEEIDALSGKTLKASVQNHDAVSAPIVAKIAELIGSVINVREITETLNAKILNTVDIRKITETIETNVTNTVTAEITGIVSTLEKPASSIETSQKTFTAGESYEVPANTNRRDITIFAAETNTDTVTVAGIPLAAGKYVGLENYIGPVTTQAVTASDQITITEVIK